MEYFTHIITFIAGLGTGWTLKIIVSNQVNKATRKTTVTQNNNTVGGDLIGGDSNNNKKG